jgi:hypothetical protein
MTISPLVSSIYIIRTNVPNVNSLRQDLLRVENNRTLGYNRVVGPDMFVGEQML